MSKKLNSRAAAAKLSWQIVDKGQSLDAALAGYFEQKDTVPQDRAFTQELVYGVCRWYGELNAVAESLLKTPIRNKDRVVHFALLIGLYQLRKLDTPEHAAVGETVAACKQLNKQWAKNLLNGCLRTYLRAPVDLQANIDRISHPMWIQQALDEAWPQYADGIMRCNNQRPPMCLRINRLQGSRQQYLNELTNTGIQAKLDPHSVDGLILTKPSPVSALPGFDEGRCSVQDTAAQLAAELLAVNATMRVLDACAAPGGKTAHILERSENKALVDALDISETRCEQLHSTLQRLKLRANVSVADASIHPTWTVPDGGYDRILIDAPCSGLGVIRRHPDIKHHRRPSDIRPLQITQAALLKNLWTLLKPGGRMLYMTCSVLPAENQTQIDQFLQLQNDAMLIDTPHPDALRLAQGAQTLPGVHAMDGFYYCLLEKLGH